MLWFLCNLLCRRVQSLEFSGDKVLRSVHTGGVTCLDLDHGEQRYLLAGAADASIAVYDTQLPSGAEAQQQQAEEREATRAAAAALDATMAPLQSSRQVAEARANPGGCTDHAALFSITKQSPGGHKYSVAAVAWYPVDSGLFVSGAGLDWLVSTSAAWGLGLTCMPCLRAAQNHYPPTCSRRLLVHAEHVHSAFGRQSGCAAPSLIPPWCLLSSSPPSCRRV